MFYIIISFSIICFKFCIVFIDIILNSYCNFWQKHNRKVSSCLCNKVQLISTQCETKRFILSFIFYRQSHFQSSPLGFRLLSKIEGIGLNLAKQLNFFKIKVNFVVTMNSERKKLRPNDIRNHEEQYFVNDCCFNYSLRVM